jgi:hypothetical protein
MHFRKSRPLFLGVLVLAFCGCTTQAPPLTKRGSVSVKLENDVKKNTVSAKIFNEVRIELPPVEQPGFAWQIFSHDTRVLKQETDIQPATDGHGPSVTFIAVHVAARSLVRFLLVKPNDRETQPIDGHDVLVTVQ